MKIYAGMIATALVLISCQASPKPNETAATPGVPTKSDASYDFGVLVANNFKASAVTLDYDAFVNGMKDVLEKNAPKVTPEQANQAVQLVLAEAQKKLGEANAADLDQLILDVAGVLDVGKVDFDGKVDEVPHGAVGAESGPPKEAAIRQTLRVGTAEENVAAL